MVERTAALALGAALSLLACGGDDHDHETPEDPALSCASADNIVIGLKKTGARSGFSVELLSTDPAPPQSNDFNTWRVHVSDAAGAPITDATFVLTGIMPKHEGHGWNITPSVISLGNGDYEISNMYLNMVGRWDITIDLTTREGSADSVMFVVCV